jgi:ribosomal protein L11 methyltransferase
MAWTRLDIPCDLDAADVVAAIVLAETGRGASVAEGGSVAVVQAWLPETCATELGARLRERLAPIADAITETLVPDDDWGLGWRRNFKAFRVSDRLVVKPSWESWPPADEPGAAHSDDLVIEIDPGGAFGTGTHASTQLALRGLEGAVALGDTVVDAGCGSGILSLAALLLGAGRVVAIDLDPAAVECTHRNLQAQGTADRAQVLMGDGLASLRGRADVIVANITAEAVVAVGLEAPGRLEAGGRYVVSGLLETSLPAVQESLEAAGLSVARTETLDAWSSLTFVREAGGA